MGHSLPRAQGEPARTRHPGRHPACSQNSISVSPGPGGTRCFRKKALGEEGLSSHPQGGSAKPKRVLCSSRGTAAEPHARQKPRHLHRRLNSSSGSARREQSPRSVDLSHSHPKSPGGTRAPRHRTPACEHRAAEGAPGLAGRSVVANPGQSSVSHQDRPRPASSPRPAPLLLTRIRSASHTRVHRQPARRTVGAAVEAPPGLYLVGLRESAPGRVPGTPPGNRGDSASPLCPPRPHTPHLGPGTACPRAGNTAVR